MSESQHVALVTGASRGIGRAVAEELARGGHRVAVHYRRSRAAARETLETLDNGPHALFQADVADPVAAGELVNEVERQLGPIAILVNNAGVFEEHRLAETTYEEWREHWRTTLDTNLLGPANLTYLVARRMMRREGGRIVNISSRGAFRGEPDAPAYGASKAGLNSLGQSMARALAPHGIFVFGVAPGWVETEMAADHLGGPQGDAIRAQSPLQRAARPEEIARLVAFLAGDGTDYLTGCIVDVNGASYLRS